jgi:methylated-DNA-[protein]-cysteine S-methyltransferase
MPNPTFATTLDTDDGPFTIVATPSHVIAAGWRASLPLGMSERSGTDPDRDTEGTVLSLGSVLSGVHDSLRPAPTTIQIFDEPSALALPLACDEGVLGRAARATLAYYDGDPSLLREVPVLQRGGPFRELALTALRDVPCGEVVSYGELAELAGRPAAVRAAATACARNAVGLFVPCHRVIRGDGSPGQYGSYGVDFKVRMLDRERAWYDRHHPSD